MCKQVINIIFILLLLSCSKDNKYIRTVENGVMMVENHKPSNGKIDVNLNKAFTIDGSRQSDTTATFFNSWFFDVDYKGNIYICDQNNVNIKKFNKNGNYVKTLAGRGSGPGELQYIYGFGIKDENLLIVRDAYENSQNLFDCNGKFIKKLRPCSNGTYWDLKQGGDSFFAVMYQSVLVDKKQNWEVSLVSLDDSLKIKQKIISGTYNFTQDSKYNTLDMRLFFDVDENYIYMSENNDEEYKINIYDHNLRLVQIITKKYRKQLYTNDEFEEDKDGLNFLNFNIEKKKVKYKKGIMGLFCDKDSNLWVMTPKEKDDRTQGVKFDVFNRKGVFQNSCYLDISERAAFLNMQCFKFKNDHLYYLNRIDARVEVYDYKLNGI